MAGKVITGTREYATLRAHPMVDQWLEKHPAQNS